MARRGRETAARPPQCAAIQDFDLSPILRNFPARSDRGYLSALQFRLTKEKENRENAVKRANLEMMLRTELYTALVASCQKSAKALGDEIVEACAYSSIGVSGAWFDGPRAHDMIILWLTRRFGAAMGRTEADIQFYEDARSVAMKYVLVDHGTGTDYAKAANAFITNILPNLSRPNPPLESALTLINMVPNCLTDTKLRLKERCAARALLGVRRECEQCARAPRGRVGSGVVAGGTAYPSPRMITY